MKMIDGDLKKKYVIKPSWTWNSFFLLLLLSKSVGYKIKWKLTRNNNSEISIFVGRQRNGYKIEIINKIEIIYSLLVSEGTQ